MTTENAPTDWRAIADRLAERLYNHAHCASHPQGDGDPRECPFCDDITAVRLYQSAGGAVRPWAPPADATTVRIEDVR